jgi:putative NADPH-quinone reductase
MGMPAFVYRWYFRAHSLRTLCSILRFVGFGRTRATLIGSIGTLEAGKREQWLQEVRVLGRKGR